MDLKNYTVRVELTEATPEKLVQVDDIMMTLEFMGFATKKDSDKGWLFRLPSGLYFGQSELNAEAICRRVSTQFSDHHLDCRIFVSEVIDWSGTEITESAT